MVYFCLDCEASGAVPPLFNLLSIGVTAVRPEGDHHEIGESLYLELCPVFPGFDPEAMAVHGLDAGRLRSEGLEPRVAMERLRDWVLERNRPSRDRPVFVGHNAVFDCKSLAMGRLGISWNETSKENLERVLALPPQDPAQAHRADYDARYQALILKALLDRAPAPPRSS
jgi:DNA polymerase III epsilon subunit-like protein